MLHRALVFSVLVALAPIAPAQESLPTLGFKRVPLAEALPDGATLSRLRVRGMLELATLDIGDTRVSQLSALAWDDDDGILYVVSDKGWLFHLEPSFTAGNLSGVKLLRAYPLTDPKTGKRLRSWLTDAEGMDIVNGRNGRKGDAELLVSFEHTPRIIRYRPDGSAIGQLTLPPVLADPKAYEHPNKMLEAICIEPQLGVLTTPEEPLAGDTDGTTRIFSLDTKTWRYPLDGDHRITAVECLGERRLLILERDFGFFRNAISLRLVTLPPTPDSTPLTPTTVVRLDAINDHRIDNFEGLTRHKGNFFFMVSDDNDLFLQRTLLMYFELLPQ